MTKTTIYLAGKGYFSEANEARKALVELLNDAKASGGDHQETTTISLSISGPDHVINEVINNLPKYVNPKKFSYECDDPEKVTSYKVDAIVNKDGVTAAGKRRIQRFLEEAIAVLMPIIEAPLEVLDAAAVEAIEQGFQIENEKVIQNFYADWNEPVSGSIQETEERTFQAAAKTGPLETDVDTIKVMVSGTGIVGSFDEALLAIEKYFKTIPDGLVRVFVEMPPAVKTELEPKLPRWVYPSELSLTKTFLFGMNFPGHDKSAFRQARKLMERAFSLKESKGAAENDGPKNKMLEV